MRIRRIGPVVLAVCAALALAGCSQSAASDEPEHIESFGVDYTIAQSGLVHVVETIKYDFGSTPDRHGIERFLYLRVPVTAEQDRVYDYTRLTVSSPTGASALVSTARQRSLLIRVGNENATLGGEQTYVVSYDIRGALNETTAANGTKRDEFYWNATGSQWQVPISHTTVRVHGPADVTATACAAGPPGSSGPCDLASSDGTSATFEVNALPTGEGVTVDVGWPSGTFDSTAPILKPTLAYDAADVYAGSNAGPDPFWTPWNWGIGLGLLIGIPLVFLLFVALRRRDLEFANETPGELPADPASAPTRPAPRHETIVAQYQPPAGFPVGAANLILGKRRKRIDTTATLIDLAARGHLRIEEVEGGASHKATDYNLVATPEKATVGDTASLLAHETLLLRRLFGARTTVSLSELSGTFSSDLQAVNAALDGWVEHGGFFVGKLSSAIRGFGWIMVAAIAVFIAMLFFPKAWLLIPVGAFAGCVIAARQSRRAHRRSAKGHAAFVKLEGFRLYISTAEADQVRFEEGIDVFSRYLPWAIVFGEAHRWTSVFSKLAEEGKFTSTPDWYVGNLHAVTGTSLTGSLVAISSIGAAVNSFANAADTSFSAAPPSSGSSGGSGFSGGGFSGGFSGGGGGGGGGGSW
jgi:uncharacterized membrane protein YgcG